MKKNFKLTSNNEYENKNAYGFARKTMKKIYLGIGTIMLAVSLLLTSCSVEAEEDLPETTITTPCTTEEEQAAEEEQAEEKYIDIVIEHEIKNDETLSEIAKQYNITSNKIAELNGIKDKNKIKVGQILNITLRLKVKTITIKENDTLTSIANKNNVTYEEIFLVNDIKDPNNIQKGQKINVPVKEIEKEYVDINEIINNFDEELDKNGYVQGIDISYAQTEKKIDLNNVLKQNKQIKYVMVRSNYFIADYDKQDDKILEYAKIAKNNNVAFGIYYWPDCTNKKETKKELNKVLEVVKELEKNNCHLTMPICLDIEMEQDGGGKVVEGIKTGNKQTLECFEYIKNFWQENGYSLIVYTGDNTKDFGVHDLVSRHGLKLWVARYPYSEERYKEVPIGRNVKEIERSLDCRYMPIGKQYAIGCVQGYNYPIDLNVWYENTPKDILEAGLNNITQIPKNQKK